MLEQFETKQPIAYKIINNTLNKKHFAHAYLIETNNYSESFKLVMTFAKMLLCPNYNNGQPNCNNCHQCQMIDDNNFPELKIINPDGNWIKKEQLTELQEEFNKKSIIGNKKIYIINKAEKLNNNSANTILKFLEEPQEGIIAILVTDNIYQLLETIISRCQIISLNGQAKFLKNKSSLEKIALLSTDNEIDYNNFIKDENNQEKINIILKFIKYYEKNHKKVLLYMNEYWFDYFQTKENISWAILILIYFYKDVLNYKINCPIEIFNDYIDNIKEVANLNNIINLTNKIKVLNTNRNYLDNNANLNLLMDKIIIEMEVNYD